jgi:predicted TIM-barrel fold metal-dependent hydrolase
MRAPVVPLPSGAIDTHAHVFLAGAAIAPNARYRPDRDAPLSTYLDLLDRTGIAGAILVQPSFLGMQNHFLLEALAQVPDRLVGVAVLSPAATLAELEDLRAAGIVGLRLNLVGRDAPPLGRDDWAEHLERVRRAGLHIEVHAEAEQWSKVLPDLVAHQLRIVVDHFGRPAHEVESCVGLKAIETAAVAGGDIWVKLSGPYRFRAAPAAALDLLRKTICRERLLWGSDWPWTQHPEIRDYATARLWLDAWIPEPVERTRILTCNAQQLINQAGGS